MQSNRRADIQLLRGVAVLGVMLAHFGSVLPAGFIGVDLFFAISGFVITLSFVRLSQVSKSPKDTLKEFWLRRFWRLSPSLSVVLSFVILASFVLLPPKGFFDQLQMTAWSTFFAGNIGVEVISKPNYFDPASGENWLLHLWSLGVEEQFYLLFPLILFAFLTKMSLIRSVRRTRLLVWAVVFTSFFFASLNELEAMVVGSTVLSDSTGISALLGYYSPLTRAWQFGLGILAALSFTGTNTTDKAATRTWLGVVLILGSLLLTPESALLPGPATLAPMIGMYLLLRWPLRDRWTRSVAGRALGWLGNRSYSAYLWHWPVWAVLGEFISPSAVSIVIAFSITVALAHITYQWVELPFIALGQSLRKPSAGAKAKATRAPSPWVAGMLVLPLFLGSAIVATNAALTASGAVLERQSVLRIDPAIDCEKVDCASIDIDVLLIGDSHAGALANELQTQLAKDGLDVAGYVHIGCLHLPNDVITSTEDGCSPDKTRVERLIDATSPSTVVLFGYTAGRFTSTNSGGEQEINLVNQRTGELVSDSTGAESYELALADTLSIFTSRNIETVIVSGVPDFSFRPEEVNSENEEATMLQRMISGQTSTRGETISKSKYLSRHSKFIEIDNQAASDSTLILALNAWDVLCYETECSQLTPDREFLFSDQDHLGPLGARRIAEAISSSLNTFQ